MSEDVRAAPAELRKEDFDEQALAMLPPGIAWNNHRAGVQPRLVRGLTGNHFHAYRRILAMLNEADPRTTVETIAMWETDCGLPDPCVGELAPSLELRRRDIIAKRQSGAVTTPQQFIDFAAALGWRISIIEFRPFRVWSECTALLNPEPDWPHAWMVVVHDEEQRITWFNAVSQCTEFIASWGFNSLECAILALAPAQTKVLFAYLPPIMLSEWDDNETGWDGYYTQWRDLI
jgi:uncharacterized protein YmfQ (DUF2313 family)